MHKEPGIAPPPLWAYAYEVLPPQPAPEWGALRALLDEEHATAAREGRRWTGKLVYKQLVTHLLVVSDHPDQDRDINRRVEKCLKAISPGFAVTAPKVLAVDESHPPKRTRRRPAT